MGVATASTAAIRASSRLIGSSRGKGAAGGRIAPKDDSKAFRSLDGSMKKLWLSKVALTREDT
jgi:hypothetical protein